MCDTLHNTKYNNSPNKPDVVELSLYRENMVCLKTMIKVLLLTSGGNSYDDNWNIIL